jgi:hypothetical protein
MFIKNLKPETLNLKLLISGLFFVQSISSQLLTPLSNEVNLRIESNMVNKKEKLFTVWKPYYDTQLKGEARQDSLGVFTAITGTERTWLKRKLFNESFIQVDSTNFYLFADPLFDFAVGKDNYNRKLTTNTRAFRAGGRLGTNFAFATEFYENQVIFNTALDSIFRKTKIIPGQGRGRIKNNIWDFAHASGYISFTPVSNLNLQLGHGKQFIGDGYRSLLLSDVSFNYPYFRATYLGRNFMYSWMIASIQNTAIDVDLGSDREPFIRESISVHLLSFNLLKQAQFSVIKCVMYNNPDTLGRMKADFNLFNPIILPGDAGNETHSVWGLNLKLALHQRIWLYQQVVFDNLFGKEPVRSAYQAGLKYFDVFGLKGLYLQTEYNRVPPYTYTSKEKSLLWSNFGEPLAYNYGSNVEEKLVRIVYSLKRWQLTSNTGFIKQLGVQNATDAYTNGIGFFENNKELFLQSIYLSWFINPKTFMNFSLGYSLRNQEIAGMSKNVNYVYFSFRTSLLNLYYDL